MLRMAVHFAQLPVVVEIEHERSRTIAQKVAEIRFNDLWQGVVHCGNRCASSMNACSTPSPLSALVVTTGRILRSSVSVS